MCALRGSLRVPSDKSLSHRVALFAAMAEGTSQVSGLLPSLDVRSTLGAVAALGAVIDVCEEETGLAGSIIGWGLAGPRAGANAACPQADEAVAAVRTHRGTPPYQDDQDGQDYQDDQDDQDYQGAPLRPDIPPVLSLDCGNSGTTARLLLGLLSGYERTALLTGDASLSRRPMNRVTVPLTTMGARFDALRDTCTRCESESSDTLPLVVAGSSTLHAIDYHSPVASAQVKSAILLAGLHAQGTTSVTEPSKSRDHTELLLPAFGVAVQTNGLTASIKGGQRLIAPSGLLAVPGDPSSAAFLLVGAALLPGSEVTVRDVLLNPTRIGFLAVMRRMGADIRIEEQECTESTGHTTLGAERVGSITVRHTPSLQATTVSVEEIPSLIDEIPILALLATGAQGTTVFEGVGELRVKESDRLAAIEEGLCAIGCQASSRGDTLFVEGGAPQTTREANPNLSRAGLSEAGDNLPEARDGLSRDPSRDLSHNAIMLITHGDHRLAMTWTIANQVYGSQIPIHIDDEACMAVSYPAFLTDLYRLST